MNANDVAHIQQAISRARAEGYEVAANIAEKSAQLAEKSGKSEVADAHSRLANVLRLFAASA